MPRDGAKACAGRYWSRGKREACLSDGCGPGEDANTPPELLPPGRGEVGRGVTAVLRPGVRRLDDALGGRNAAVPESRRLVSPSLGPSTHFHRPISDETSGNDTCQEPGKVIMRIAALHRCADILAAIAGPIAEALHGILDDPAVTAKRRFL